MRLYQRIITGGLVIAGLAGLFGYNKSQDESEQNNPRLEAIAELAGPNPATAITTGDYNNDGNLDVVVTARENMQNVKAYLLLGDGTGNFRYK